MAVNPDGTFDNWASETPAPVDRLKVTSEIHEKNDKRRIFAKANLYAMEGNESRQAVDKVATEVETLVQENPDAWLRIEVPVTCGMEMAEELLGKLKMLKFREGAYIAIGTIDGSSSKSGYEIPPAEQD